MSAMKTESRGGGDDSQMRAELVSLVLYCRNICFLLFLRVKNPNKLKDEAK